jgi:predicted TIM-barrel fold metal-dependent hydrolase
MNGGAWDCHAHVFGPYTGYPLAAERSYTPPEAPAEAYAALLRQLALAHGVVVHPSAYGTDLSLLFDVLSAHPDWRGVIVTRPGQLRTLQDLRERGIRAARFSHRGGSAGDFAGSASFDDLLSLAPALADAGLHAELWTDCRVLPDIVPAIRRLPVPVVIDHMGGFDVATGVDAPGFRALRSLVADRSAWVKLCVYRNLASLADPTPGRPFHRALVAADPERLVWGSDWPHLRVSPEPDAGELLSLLREWTDDPAVVEQILVRNPQALYG